MFKRINFKQIVFTVINSVITKYSLILLIVAVLPFSLVLNLLSSEVKKEEISRTSADIDSSLKIISLSIDNMFKNAESIHASLLLDDEFMQLLHEIEGEECSVTFDTLQRARKVKDILNNTAVRSPYLKSIYLYINNAKRLFISSVNSKNDYMASDITDQEWYHCYESLEKSSSWNLTKSLECDGDIFSSYRITASPSAIISVNISEKLVQETIQASNPISYASCFLVDTNNHIISDGKFDNELVNKILVADSNEISCLDVDGSCLLCRSYRSSYTGFTVYMFTDTNNCTSSFATMEKLYKLYVLDSIILIITAIILTSVVVIKPIRFLSNRMQRPENEILNMPIEVHGNNEISSLYRSFNHMNQSIIELIQNNYIGEIKRKNFELKLLGTQINEHFLYNTLDAIRWTAVRENCKETASSVMDLATFYRIGLSYGDDHITVRDLYTMTDSYLKMQKRLHDGTIEYDIQFNVDFYDLKVPKYIFIPLVENAVRHGIKGKMDGVIFVSLEPNEGLLRFTVTDNGCGITEERLSQINECLSHQNTHTSECFALRNINAQLGLYFKKYNGITIRSVYGKGTAVYFDFSPETLSVSQEL